MSSAIGEGPCKSLLFSCTTLEHALPEVGRTVAQLLLEVDPFVTWMMGEVGSGKTTLTRHILRGLGLDPRIPVSSPTYGFMNDYNLPSGIIAHLDMYRGGNHLDEIGLDIGYRYRGFLIEWPDIGGAERWMLPTHQITLEPTLIGNEEGRVVCLYRLQKLPGSLEAPPDMV